MPNFTSESPGKTGRSRGKVRHSKQEGKAKPHDILVLHDKASDFRSFTADELKELIRLHYKPEKTWIIWQMYSPVADGNLWQAIASEPDWLKRTVAVVKIDCLRQAGANIPDNISLEKECDMFEQSIRDTAGTSPRLVELASVGHLVVDFHRQGILHYASQKACLETSCYYCPHISDQPSSAELGTMVGYTSILVAAIARSIAWSMMRDQADVPKAIIDGIKQGVVLDHLHYLHGYADGDGEQDILKPGAPPPKPYVRLFAKLDALRTSDWREGERDYRLAALPLGDPKGSQLSRITAFIERTFDPPDHSVLQNKNEEEKDALTKALFKRHAEETMRNVVLWGLEKVVEKEANSADDDGMPIPPHALLCPFEVHGKFKTAYRDEIDSLASIRRIIEKYLNDSGWESPLSIAVFGPPGAGKNFTILQLLESVNPDIAKRSLEYNIAQFVDQKDLETAFRKVQDEAVAGDVPLAFFDEFDANFPGEDEVLGWLKYFLSPMQDGKFKAGESTYRIGRAIFVFVGGISKNWKEFYEDRKTMNEFRDAKGPDFVSRLRGYLNIKSINPEGNTEVDHILMFRRAILLRSLLEHRLKGIFDKNTKVARLDHRVISAFLKIPRYEHESRSMQAIIEMSRLSPRGQFQVSSLPAEEQLRMHVDAREFYKLAR